jgi:hypothetical protein
MNRTKSQATVFSAPDLAMFTPHIHPYTMVCAFAGLTCGSDTAVKSLPTGDCRICRVAQGPVMDMAVRPSRNSWLGLAEVFIVVAGSPAALPTSRHNVDPCTAAGLLR